MKKNPYILKLSGEKKSGAEHSVFLDHETGLVRKIPNRFGKLWQEMDPESAQTDLDAMGRAGVPVVPTQVDDSQWVKNGGSDEEWAEYVLTQPLLGDVKVLDYAQLHHNVSYQRQLLELFFQGQEIRMHENRSFDMLGGQVVVNFLPAMNPFVQEMNPVISNILVPQKDIRAKSPLPQSGVDEGDVVAHEGELMQCDTRLYNLKSSLAPLLKIMQDAQDTAIATVLKSFNFKVRFDTEKTRFRRMVARLLDTAIPKMRACADGVIG